jgi:hypothetical protein
MFNDPPVLVAAPTPVPALLLPVAPVPVPPVVVALGRPPTLTGRSPSAIPPQPTAKPVPISTIAAKRRCGDCSSVWLMPAF